MTNLIFLCKLYVRESSLKLCTTNENKSAHAEHRDGCLNSLVTIVLITFTNVPRGATVITFRNIKTHYLQLFYPSYSNKQSSETSILRRTSNFHQNLVCQMDSVCKYRSKVSQNSNICLTKRRTKTWASINLVVTPHKALLCETWHLVRRVYRSLVMTCHQLTTYICIWRL